jgi:hypothetical protein
MNNETEKKKKPTKIEIQYDDGSKEILNGIKAQKWIDDVNDCANISKIHGCSMKKYDWEITEPRKTCMETFMEYFI